MSHELWVHKFVDGENVPPDMSVVRDVLAPHDTGEPVVDDEGKIHFSIRAADGGEADLVASDNGVLIDRPARGEILAIVADLVSRLGAVIIDPRDAAFICRAEERAQLPAQFQEDAVVIEMNGQAIERTLTGPRS
ncbi:hypothetical protein AB5J72_39710 [Streptomyces sp. CG1]|uniref:hypothetical protein n=1 Tax=Streptomyces sp. CG1 TaxID=1287523 RepID=UPI0034E1C554